MTGSDATSKILSALAEPRRRLILRHLIFEGGSTASYEELIEMLLTAEDGPDRRDQAEIELYHRDLPALEAAQLVEHDDRSETVRYCESSFVENVLGDRLDPTRTQ